MAKLTAYEQVQWRHTNQGVSDTRDDPSIASRNIGALVNNATEAMRQCVGGSAALQQGDSELGRILLGLSRPTFFAYQDRGPAGENEVGA